MIPPGILSASRARVSATRRLRSSLSKTHGPAIRKSLSAGKNSATLFRRFLGRALPAGSGWRFRLNCGANKTRKERMRARRTGLKLGMELAADVPRVCLQLDHLDQRAVR